MSVPVFKGKMNQEYGEVFHLQFDYQAFDAGIKIMKRFAMHSVCGYYEKSKTLAN